MKRSGGKTVIYSSLAVSCIFALLDIILLVMAGRQMITEWFAALVLFIVVCVVLLAKGWFMDSKLKKVLFSVFSAVVIVNNVFLLFFPLICSSESSFGYGFQKSFTGLYGYRPDILPEKLPENISEYSFTSFSGAMQADPFAYLFIKTDKDTTEKIRSEAEQNAIFSFDLKSYIEDSSNNEIAEFKEKYGQDERNHNKLYFNTEKYSEDPADGTIYLISYDSTVSGDDYSYIIVSDEKCAVQFSDRG